MHVSFCACEKCGFALHIQCIMGCTCACMYLWQLTCHSSVHGCVSLRLCVWPAGLCWYSILPPVTVQLCENVPGLNVYVWEAPGEHHTFMKFINVSYFWHPQNVLFFTLSYWWSRLELGSVDPSSY